MAESPHHILPARWMGSRGHPSTFITEPVEMQMDSKLHCAPGDGAAPGLRAGLAKEVKSLDKLEKGTAKNSNELPSLGTQENL